MTTYLNSAVYGILTTDLSSFCSTILPYYEQSFQIANCACETYLPTHLRKNFFYYSISCPSATLLDVTTDKTNNIITNYNANSDPLYGSITTLIIRSSTTSENLIPMYKSSYNYDKATGTTGLVISIVLLFVVLASLFYIKYGSEIFSFILINKIQPESIINKNDETNIHYEILKLESKDNNNDINNTNNNNTNNNNSNDNTNPI